MIVLLILLLAVHALADYPLQGGFLAKAKRPGGIPGVPWQWALGAHVWIHAVGVAVVTGRLYPGVIELVSHTAIDYLKCRDKFGSSPSRAFHIDQALHVATKVVIVALRYKGLV